MPTDIKIDSTSGDYDLSTRGLQFIKSNPEAVAQRLRVALQMRKGEIFTDIQHGIPLSEFSSYRDGGTFADAFMISYILKVEGVVDIISYTSSINSSTRVFNPVVIVKTTSGDILTIDGGS